MSKVLYQVVQRVCGELGLTLNDLAKETGYADGYLKDLLKGRAKMSPSSRQKILTGLKVLQAKQDTRPRVMIIDGKVACLSELCTECQEILNCVPVKLTVKGSKNIERLTGSRDLVWKIGHL